MFETNPSAWRGMKHPDSDLVGLVYRFARPGRDVCGDRPRAIDVGCGPGRHVRFLNEAGYRAYGIDADPEMCACCHDNGVEAILTEARDYRPPEPPALALCWGVMMLLPDCPDIVARWRPQLVIADWRTRGNSCFDWPGNEPIASRPGWVRLHHPGHLLDGDEYRSHELSECEIPGYERIHWQRVARQTADEQHEWWQTVHRRR
jgi:SAM-dependent methyltransferase